MKLHGLSQVLGNLIERTTLGDNRNLETFGGVSRLLAGSDDALIVR